MTIWYSSDLHLGHYNIIKYTGRPFDSTSQMDEFLIDTHNAYVKPEDHWWNLGDVTMLRGGKEQQAQLKALISRFNGHKRLILGNHDHFPVEAYLEAGFEKVMALHRHDDIIFSHIPIHPFSMGRSKGNCHGHIHQNPNYPPVRRSDGVIQPYLNISVEAINYTPVSLEQVKAKLEVLRASAHTFTHVEAPKEK